MKTTTALSQEPAKPMIRFTDTTLRDAHQSLWATRMRTSDIVPILETIDAAGYYSLECWGGATFDVCLRFLREDPWERLRLIRSHCKTPLQMLLRGQNILGYKNYPDDILRRFVELSAKNGIDIFRIFDALNDPRNIESAVKAVRSIGAHAQCAISYTSSPVHTEAAYVKLAKELEQIGADSICIKDMAGILNPAEAERLVKALCAAVSIPLQIHGHMTSGMAVATYTAAVNAGVQAVDTCISTLSGCSSQPPLQTIDSILKAYGYYTNIDLDAVRKTEDYFKKIAPLREPANASRQFVDTGVLRHHIPGGMISNLRSQLQQQNALDRLDEVLEELPRVRADMGYPPLVTPTSQIIGIQATLNVLSGERYAMAPEETVNYVKGLYGKSPAPVNPDIAAKILKGSKRVVRRPADLLRPGLEQAAERLPCEYTHSEEDILSFCLFPEVALGYFEWRARPENERPPSPADVEQAAATKTTTTDVQAAKVSDSTHETGTQRDDLTTVTAPLNGTFYRRAAGEKSNFIEENDEAEQGRILCAVEAMKLMNNVVAPQNCRIVKFFAQHGTSVKKGEPLFSYMRL